MAKARARAAAKKVRDKWRAKNWYKIIAPPMFNNIEIADTPADKTSNLINRVTEVSMQDLTNDFRKSHIKLFFQIHKIEESNALTRFIGHTLAADYVRRLIRRRRSRIDGVYDVTTRDGAVVRVKPFATTEKRIQSSQKRLIRNVMKKTIIEQAKTKTLSEFIKDALDGKIGSEIYKNCKNLYPVKRIEIYKTEVKKQPTIKTEEEKPAEKTKEEEKTKTEKEEKKKTEEETKTSSSAKKKIVEKKKKNKTKATAKTSKSPNSKQEKDEEKRKTSTSNK
ncbi:MAG: 30S ribosomal protein S3ae [Thermoplasmata archaeon]|nr:MAG: 30S ribosomal protein S3ae [Thermoplasmata archaeon]